MDNIRLLLVLSLGAVLFLIYQSWVQDYGPTQLPPAASEQPLDSSYAQDSSSAPLDAPDAPTPATPSLDAGMLPGDANAQSVETAGRPITVDTDLVRAEISTVGGTIQSMWLKNYAQVAHHPDDKFRLLKPQPPNMFIVQSGLLGGGDTALPNHKAVFSADQPSFELAPNADSLTVQLRWSNAAGI